MMYSAVRRGLLVLLILFSGCLPHSCRREESSALLPADSLSRSIALSIPPDTLDLAWRSGGSDEHLLEHPRTVRFGSGDTLFVSDVERNSLFIFGDEGRRVAEQQGLGFNVPYIVGVRGDTVAVFNPEPLRVDFVAGGLVVGSVPIADEERTKHDLVYAAQGDKLFYKRVSAESGGIIGAVAADGQLTETFDLKGAQWRLAGLLRPWGDSLLSLSGFRPVIDVVARGSRIDTLALRGFDSPMLARSRSFITGETHQAPLLSAAAAPAGDLLFVLNLRAGWLQIDVFDREGMLRHRLVQREQEYRKAFYPQDLDVRQLGDGVYEIAVALSAPQPVVEVYRWRITAPALP